MELAYTVIFFIFIFTWFSKYNFISFVLFVNSCNIIRNVRIYMLKNQVENSPNPFLRAIKWSGDTLEWIRTKLNSSGSGFSERCGFIKWCGSKYIELNNHFLELLTISKKQTIEQFAGGFNYTLTNVLSLKPHNLAPGLNSQSIKTTNQEISQLNREYEKKNSIYVPLFSSSMKFASDFTKSQILKSAQQTIKTQDEISAISSIIKDLDTQIKLNECNKRIDIYDSDDENYSSKEKTE